MQQQASLGQMTLLNTRDDLAGTWAEAFIMDRRVQGKSSHTIRYYTMELKKFLVYLDAQSIEKIADIAPDTLRSFMFYLTERGQSPGGVHAAYRAVKAFLFWYEDEAEPEGWKNPARKVKPPSVPVVPLEPVAVETVQAMMQVCKHGILTGERNRALLLALLDTGARAAELLSVDLTDVNAITGALLIRQGKGKKPRTVYLGQKTRKAVRAYLKLRQDTHPALWVNDEFERLAYDGLRSLLTRLAQAAGVTAPTPHDFRRAFALTMLRNGTDLITLSRLMGHTSLAVLTRYLKQTGDDLENAFRRASPVDTNF